MDVELIVDPEGWVDRHGDCLYRYALLRLRRPDVAADLVQETFLQALESADSFAGRSLERTWLIGILRHKIVDHFRRAARQATLGNMTGADAEFDHRGHWKVGPAAWRGDPSRDIETREFWEVFGQCLSKLPSGLSDAFFLRELDGLTSEAVQELLGISPANLWARLHRARSQLRKCLEIGWFGPQGASTPRRNAKGVSSP